MGKLSDVERGDHERPLDYDEPDDDHYYAIWSAEAQEGKYILRNWEDSTLSDIHQHFSMLCVHLEDAANKMRE